MSESTANGSTPARTSAGKGHVYRADIDGLRALAIIPVVAFHAFPAAVPGGFVGVDVFFVISGYLITGIILEQLRQGTFTFGHFYQRRIRRIFPALILVLVASQVWGWFRLYAADYERLGKHVAAGAGFAANLVLWSEAGYFDGVSETKPLLHLWSLGIEEQFYLVWPALLYLVWVRRVNVVLTIAALLTASFFFNAILVRTDEVAAFFSPMTRLWELLLGAVWAHFTLQGINPAWPARGSRILSRLGGTHGRNAAAALGLFAIVAAAALFDRDTSFPGWRAALPAGGALLLIAAGSDAWINRRFLSVRPLVWVGLISYPLYLWHWPLLSFASLSAGGTDVSTRFTLLGISVLVAWLTYVAIERPIRFTWRGRGPVAVLAVLMLATGTAGYVTVANEGYHERSINRSDQGHFLAYYERLRARGLAAAYRAECDFMDWQSETTRETIAADCTRPGDRATVFLWGDSHAQALSHGLRHALPAGVRLAQVTTSGCPPRLREADPLAIGGRCRIANAFARDRIAALEPEVVVLAQILAHERTDWTEMATTLRALGVRRVVLVGPAPQWMPTLPLVVVNHHWGRRDARVSEGLNSEVFETDRILRSRYADSSLLTYVSLIDALCTREGCTAVVPGTDGELMAVDNGHLSPAASIYVADTVLRAHVVDE
jgi:peptidoglycan/LPS O-acetylase OafA/YrhL